MKKIIKGRFFLIISIAMLCLCMSSCSSLEGYGVLLWSIPEHGLSDGDVVPVYFKSNIGKVYAIGIPETETKLEIPLWQITDIESKRAATERANLYAEYKHQYASVKVDGLAIRSEPVNTADQVYRLREEEIIKILYKGEGQLVMRGSTPLEGDWMRVLASDGTKGWCFTYNLIVYDEREGIQTQLIDTNGEKDEIVQTISKKLWYPLHYKEMIDSGKINLSRMNTTYSFDPGLLSGTVSVVNEKVATSEVYSGITRKNAKTYTYNDTEISLIIYNENRIDVECLDEIGRRVTHEFVAFNQDYIQELNARVGTESSEEVVEGEVPVVGITETTFIAEVIRLEQAARNNQYKKILELSQDFYSSSYGSLNFSYDNTFTWKGYQILLDSNIEGLPSVGGLLGRGTLSIQYHISNALREEFDGVLSFRFDTSNEDLNLLYKIEEKGIRFESVDKIDKEDGIITSRSNNPLVMYFNKK